MPTENVENNVGDSPKARPNLVHAEGDSQMLQTLEQILSLLRERLPVLEPKPLWWKRRSNFLIAVIGIVLLAFVNFPSQEQKKADLVLVDGTQLRLVLKPGPNWEKLGIPRISDYRKVPMLLEEHIQVDTLLEVQLRHQGAMYRQSGIRVYRKEGVLALISPEAQS